MCVDLIKDKKDMIKFVNVLVYIYIYFYFGVLNNDIEIKNFDFNKYVKVELIYYNDNYLLFKIFFNEEYGGDFLRVILIDVDLKNNKN